MSDEIALPPKLSKLDLAVIQETHPEAAIRKLAQEARLLRDENERLETALRAYIGKCEALLQERENFESDISW